MYTEKYFTERLTYDPRRAQVWVELNHFFGKYYPDNLRTVVELGAGYCFWINNIKSDKKIAIDISPVVEKHAKEDVEAIVRDASDLSFLPDKSVDMFLASNFFEHFAPEKVEEILKNIYRVLSNGGRLCILQPNFKYAYREYFDDHTHRAIFTDTGMCNLLKECGFNIKLNIPRFTPYSFKSSKLPTPRFLIKAYLNSPVRPGAKQMAIVVEKK